MCVRVSTREAGHECDELIRVRGTIADRTNFVQMGSRFESQLTIAISRVIYND